MEVNLDEREIPVVVLIHLEAFSYLVVSLHLLEPKIYSPISVNFTLLFRKL